MNKFVSILACAVALTLAWPTPANADALKIGGNTATDGFDPITSTVYSELRSTLTTDFPGTTFHSLSALSGDLSSFDLIILNRFKSNDLLPAEQAAVVNYVTQGGNVLYVGEAGGGVSNDTFTLPFGVAMTPDPTTDVTLAVANYTNSGHPFLNGSFGAPFAQPSGSFAAQVSTLGPTVELARWTGGGVAISAFNRNAIAPGSGFGLFLTDVNMITPFRYSQEVGAVLSNALSVPEPSALAIPFSVLICLWRRRRSASH